MFFSSENLLGLPQEKFGLADIYLGNVISKEIAKQDKGYKVEYNPIRNRITILNTSDLPPSVLNKMLYESSASREYDTLCWYPIVKEERNKEGNLEIDFSCLKPGLDHSNSHSLEFDSMFLTEGFDSMFLTDFDQPQIIKNQLRSPLMSSNILSLKPTMFESSLISERSSIRSNPRLPTIDLEEDVLDKEEVTLMEKSISEGVINAMSQFLNKHEMTKGIWYPDDYRKYLMDKFDTEMDESFYTGFANEKFFEKTGRFTFKLKDGEKASEALLSFLEGPTVADCGNATMACYYKCILDIIGKDKFDNLFNSKPFTLTIGQQGIADKTSPISYLAEYTKAAHKMTTGVLGKRPLEIGQECHFGGVIWYGNKHPEGFAGGWNVIYIGNNKEGQQLFMAHGFEKPLTENEINQELVELYNRERTPQDEQSIIQAQKPKLYDRETNKYLVSHYIISDKEIEETPSKFIKGFLANSIRGLKIDELIMLKNAKNIDQFKLKLMTKKVSSIFQSLFF